MADTPKYESSVINTPVSNPSAGHGYEELAKTLDDFATNFMSMRQGVTDQLASQQGAAEGGDLGHDIPGTPITQTARAYNQAFMAARQAQLEVQIKGQSDELASKLMANPSLDNLQKFQAGSEGILTGVSESTPAQIAQNIKQYAQYTTIENSKDILNQNKQIAHNKAIADYYDNYRVKMDQIQSAIARGDGNSAGSLLQGLDETGREAADFGLIKGETYNNLVQSAHDAAQDAVQQYNINKALSDKSIPEYLDYIKNNNGLRSDQRDKYKAQALKAQSDQNAIYQNNKSQADEEMKNALAYVKKTGDVNSIQGTLGKITDSYPAKAKDFLEDIQLAQTQHAVQEAIKYLPPEEAKNVINQLIPEDNNDPEYAKKYNLINNLNSYYKDIEDIRQKDPASLMLQDPTVQNSQNQARLATMQSAGDQPPANQVYNTLIQREKAVGVTDGNLSVMPNAHAKSFIASISNLDVMKQFQAYNQEVNNYGKQGYIAQRDLLKNGLNPAFPLAHSMSNTYPQYLPEFMASQKLDNSKNIISESSAALIKTNLNSALRGYYKSLQGYNNLSPDAVNGYNKAIYNYAVYLNQYRGYPETDAANLAAQRTLNSLYDTTNYNGQTVRIPKGYSTSTMSQLFNYVQNADIDKIGNNFVIPDSYGPNKDQYLTDLKSHGYFVTTPDDTGVMFVDGFGSPVQYKNENNQVQELRFGFDELKDSESDVNKEITKTFNPRTYFQVISQTAV